MAWTTWWLFAVTTALICATPGPNMLHILQRAATLGLARTVPAMAGCLSAVLLCVTASALGMGALLTASRALFEVLRYAGVGYLLWLAWKSWTASVERATGVHPADGARSLGVVALYRTALLTGLANPKLLIFAAAFFPQFIRADRPWAPQFAILVATFALCETGRYLLYALGGKQIARVLAGERARRRFNRLTGSLFAAFGVGLLAYRA